jgi:hypothetical protein
MAMGFLAFNKPCAGSAGGSPSEKLAFFDSIDPYDASPILHE